MLPLSDYGVIGNGASSALVSRLGSIDWCSFPSLDSPSHFASLLNDSTGGRFAIQPQGEFRSEQRYWARTLVLETLFETPTGRGLLTDWMPAQSPGPSPGPWPADESMAECPAIYRKITTLHGKVRWSVLCSPRFGGGKAPTGVERARGQVLFRGAGPGERAFLTSDTHLDTDPQRGIALARFELEAGQGARFNWIWGRQASLPVFPGVEPSIQRWRSWAHRCPEGVPCPLAGPWHDLLAQSGLVLRVLFTPFSGAVADSISPARLSEPRSSRLWDAPTILRALSALGLTSERDAYFTWLCDLLERDGAAGLQPSYSIDGGKLPGHGPGHGHGRGITPPPAQLGILGQLALAIREYHDLTGILPRRAARALMGLAEFACQAWRRPDQDPLELPTKPEHFVSSKILCWSALDQACRLLDADEVEPRWRTERETLWETIATQGFDPRAGSFVRSFSSREVGVGALFVPLLGFLPPEDPRVIGTLRAVSNRLASGAAPSLKGGLLLVSALARCGRTAEATELFSELCSRASSLGLFAEELAGPELIGAFPSASVHAQLICASLDIHAGAARPLTLVPGLPSLSAR